MSNTKRKNVSLKREKTKPLNSGTYEFTILFSSLACALLNVLLIPDFLNAGLADGEVLPGFCSCMMQGNAEIQILALKSCSHFIQRNKKNFPFVFPTENRLVLTTAKKVSILFPMLK